MANSNFAATRITMDGNWKTHKVGRNVRHVRMHAFGGAIEVCVSAASGPSLDFTLEEGATEHWRTSLLGHCNIHFKGDAGVMEILEVTGSIQ
jgi:hypothetical protein